MENNIQKEDLLALVKSKIYTNVSTNKRRARYFEITICDIKKDCIVTHILGAKINYSFHSCKLLRKKCTLGCWQNKWGRSLNKIVSLHTSFYFCSTIDN